MRYLNWIFRVVVFLALLGLAVKNNQPVTLHYFFDYQLHTSLVVILLIFFAVGAALGILAMLANVLQQRREIAQLQSNMRVKNKLGNLSDKSSPIQTF